jgi:hypothetical protein
MRTLEQWIPRSGLAALLLVAACGTTPPTRFYALDPVASTAPVAAGTGKTTSAIGVKTVAVPAAVDRPQIVVRSGDARVVLDDFNRWAGPLRDEIARVVAGNLASDLGGPVITVSSALPAPSNLMVLLDVQRFDAKLGEGVEVDVVWVVRRAIEEAPGRSGRSATREKAEGSGYEALIAAYNRALASVSKDIAATIRAF